MVFSGRPSSACQACRQSRRKCDRVPTGCSQCRRKDIECSGYRDPTILRMRDETSRMALKFQKLSYLDKSRTATSSPASSTAIHEDDNSTSGYQDYPLAEDNLMLVRSLSHPVSDIAMSYFINSYIVITPFENYLPELCNPYTADATDNAFCLATSATSLAAFARRIRSSQQLNIARQKYSAALIRLNALLANPKTAVLDETLAAVLLLGFFEATVFPGGQAPTSWTAHTFGAMRLLSLRGAKESNFRSEISRQLFLQTCSNVRTSYIQNSAPVPDHFVDFYHKAAQWLDPKHHMCQIAPIMDKVSCLKAQLTTPRPSANLLYEALQCDYGLLAIAQNLPTDKKPRHEAKDVASIMTESWQKFDLSHQHSNLRITKLWTSIRLLRFFLVLMIAEGVSGANEMDFSDLIVPNGFSTEQDFLASLEDYAAKNMAELAFEVIDSVPKHLEMINGREKRFTAPARNLAWPLTIVAKSSLCPAITRELAFVYLRKLASDLNMPQVVSHTGDLGGQNDWLHLLHLG